MALTLLLVRHGESLANRRRLYSGWSDPPLTAAGRRHLRRRAVGVAAFRADLCVSSDLRRARQSALVLCPDLPRIERPAFREIHFGCWEGLRHEEILARWPREYASWLADPLNAPIPGGENWTQFSVRLAAGVAELRRDFSDRRVVLVAHGGVLRCLRRPTPGTIWQEWPGYGHMVEITLEDAP